MEKEISLTHQGKRIEHLKGDDFGVPGEERRFTRGQIAEALSSRAILFLQTDTEGPTTVTSEIEVLLKARETIKRTGTIEELLVPREQAT